jgi:hypothetical protein
VLGIFGQNEVMSDEVEPMGWKLMRTEDEHQHELLPHFDIGPVGSIDDVMAFDRGVCERGCKRFMRDLTDFDFPPGFVEGERRRGYTQVIVEEMFPGARRRSTVSGYVIKRQDLCQN